MFVAAVGCAPLQPVSSTSDKKRYVNYGAFAPVRQHFTPKAGFPDMVFNAAAPDCRADWQPRSTVSAHLYLMATCPQVGFSRAMTKMSLRRSLGILGLPMRRDFHRQNNLKPLRCHPVKVSGRTVIKAAIQSKSFASNTIVSRVASVARRGRTWRS